MQLVEIYPIVVVAERQTWAKVVSGLAVRPRGTGLATCNPALSSRVGLICCDLIGDRVVPSI